MVKARPPGRPLDKPDTGQRRNPLLAIEKYWVPVMCECTERHTLSIGTSNHICSAGSVRVFVDAQARAISRRGLTLGMAGVGLNAALSDLFGGGAADAASKKCKKKKKRSGVTYASKSCKKKKAVVPLAPPPSPPHITCTPDKEPCGGACVLRRPAPATLNPVTCQCCLPANVPCGPEPPIAPCCLDSPIACFFNVCVGGAPGNPCQFSGQCQPGVNRVNGFCTR